MAEEIINKVAKSGLQTLDLEEYFPKEEFVGIDLKEVLYMEQIIREKDLRAFVKEHNWQLYANKNVYLHCSVDAIIPAWAYMLISIQLSQVAASFIVGSKTSLIEKLYFNELSKLDLNEYENARVVIKGCSKKEVPLSVYAELSRLLTPVAKSIMFGEPCSTVPLYKKK